MVMNSTRAVAAVIHAVSPLSIADKVVSWAREGDADSKRPALTNKAGVFGIFISQEGRSPTGAGARVNPSLYYECRFW